MNNSERRKKVSSRLPRPGSPPQSGQNSNGDEEGAEIGRGTGLGDAYLQTLSPPALPRTPDVYHEVYASVRAILERFHYRHAPTAVKAAWDASASYITESLATSGGAER